MPAPINSNNPNAIPVATQVMCSVADTAAKPSIIFGGGDVQHNAGTGIYGSATEINFSVGGVEVLSLDAGGFVLPGDISLDEVTVTSLTANKAVVSSGTKKLISSTTSLAELAFVTGVTSAIQVQLDAKLPSASFTDAAVTGKLLTGYSSSAGVVAATDTILVGFNKLNGNADAISTVANAALPSASFTDAAVTSKLLTGFVSGAGVVASTDTILQGFNKLDGNVAAKAPIADPVFSNNVRIVGNLGVGNSAAAATPGTVTKKIEIFDAAGASLGFIAVYDAIT